ncbi:hypothetical protein DPMN_173990 [Dreissena polymorpha]|uniref:Uncharacterized protein n=1 Tax=Dreissena polymorpha TaxID=45954 RepID=A0A9D4E4I7_DREPO|nr:hypothetical protein DPMN_173990 [Dreissena polymorpha]
MLTNILGYDQEQREARVEAYSLTAIHQCNDKKTLSAQAARLKVLQADLRETLMLCMKRRMSYVSSPVRMLRTHSLPKPY